MQNYAEFKHTSPPLPQDLTKKPRRKLKILSAGRSASPAAIKMKLFLTSVNSWKPLYTVTKSSILYFAGILICLCYLPATGHLQGWHQYISLYALSVPL